MFLVKLSSLKGFCFSFNFLQFSYFIAATIVVMFSLASFYSTLLMSHLIVNKKFKNNECVFFQIDGLLFSQRKVIFTYLADDLLAIKN